MWNFKIFLQLQLVCFLHYHNSFLVNHCLTFLGCMTHYRHQFWFFSSLNSYITQDFFAPVANPGTKLAWFSIVIKTTVEMLDLLEHLMLLILQLIAPTKICALYFYYNTELPNFMTKDLQNYNVLMQSWGHLLRLPYTVHHT